MVSQRCLKEVNRLRETDSKYLPLYELPFEAKVSTKRNITGTSDESDPK